MKAIGALYALVFFLGQPLWAQSGTTLLVNTDVACNWKLDGQLMGVLSPERPQIVLVTPGDHVIEASTVDASATMHSAVKVEKAEKRFDILLRTQADSALNKPTQNSETEMWSDIRTGLMWAVKDNGSDVDWYQASAYCANSDLGGYKDWRLPSIEELEGVYDPSSTTRDLFESGSIPDVHIKGNRRLTGSEWSSTLQDASRKPSIGAWMFNFGDPGRTHGNVGKRGITFLSSHYSLRALCVRLP